MDEETHIERYEPAARSLAQRRPALPSAYTTVEMEEAPDLLAYWRVLRKRRWTVFTLFLVFFTTVLIGTLKQKPLYHATALLEIEKENPNILTVQELFTLETVSDTYLESQYKILQSESLAWRVIEQLALPRVAEFNPPPGWWAARQKKTAPTSPNLTVGATLAEDADAEKDQDVLERFRRRLSVQPVKRSRLVTISFESLEPPLAARVVNALAANYIEQNLEARWEATQKAAEFLSQQLLGMKARLEKSEEELQGYARRHGLLFLENQQGAPENIVNERLRQLQEELTRAQAARYEKESLYRLVEAGDYASLPGVFENKLLQDLSVRLAELRREHAQLSATFTPDYPKVKQIQSQLDELEAVLARERERAAAHLRNDYQAARRREALLRQAFAEQQRQANRIAEQSVQYNILKREVETNKQLYEGLLQRLKEAGVSAGLKASNIRIVDAAAVPERPVKPRVLLNLTLGLLLGLGLGVGAAFLQEHLDNTLKTAEDVERFLRLPALALIPSVESLNGRRGAVYGLAEGKRLLLGEPKEASGKAGEQASTARPHWYRIDVENQKHSALLEAFRSLRTSVLLSTAERPPRSLLVSSSQPGEGKTTISTNLAISLAQLGQRVLLIDSDMRRPCLHKAFALAAGGGLASYLAGQQNWPALAQPTGIPGLNLLACGPIPPNPAELLSSERMRTLIREAAAEYHVVLLDSPPLLNVADSRILATLVEGVLLVVEGGATPRDLVQRARAYAREVGAHVIGVVLNNLDVRADDYYYYRYYQHDYYDSRAETAAETEESP